ncbi:MAG: hypothetical protein GY830_06585 [Bacteroidetes bacterium]|nr:hypothetical protein [Bacteroidota bacterium]
MNIKIIILAFLFLKCGSLTKDSNSKMKKKFISRLINSKVINDQLKIPEKYVHYPYTRKPYIKVLNKNFEDLPCKDLSKIKDKYDRSYLPNRLESVFIEDYKNMSWEEIEQFVWVGEAWRRCKSPY